MCRNSQISAISDAFAQQVGRPVTQQCNDALMQRTVASRQRFIAFLEGILTVLWTNQVTGSSSKLKLRSADPVTSAY
jgi:hypothetical protein